MAKGTTQAPGSQVGGDLDWTGGLRTGNQVDLVVYGQRMTGKLLKINPDNFTVRIPIEAQTMDVRRFSVTGTAIISLDAAAANVPVSVQSTGEFVKIQIIGPATIVQRRRFQRVRIAVPVKLAWRSGGTWHYAESSTEDVSTGGLRIAPARAVWPSAGEEITASIELANGTVLQEKAKVIGKTPAYGLRIEFLRVTRGTRAWITELIEGPKDDDDED
jgi:hypothetical protein